MLNLCLHCSYIKTVPPTTSNAEVYVYCSFEIAGAIYNLLGLLVEIQKHIK